MKKKEPQGDTDELAEGLSALSLTQKENNEVQVSQAMTQALNDSKTILDGRSRVECKTVESSRCTNCRASSSNKS